MRQLLFSTKNRPSVEHEGIKEPRDKHQRRSVVFNAWSGCDSKSYFFGKSKATIMKILKKSGKFRSITQVIINPDSSPEAVGRASALAVKLMYDGQENDDLKKYG